MKQKKDIVISSILTYLLFSITLVFLCVLLAYKERGYYAVGGEVLVVYFLFMFLFIIAEYIVRYRNYILLVTLVILLFDVFISYNMICSKETIVIETHENDVNNTYNQQLDIIEVSKVEKIILEENQQVNEWTYELAKVLDGECYHSDWMPNNDISDKVAVAWVICNSCDEWNQDIIQAISKPNRVNYDKSITPTKESLEIATGVIRTWLGYCSDYPDNTDGALYFRSHENDDTKYNWYRIGFDDTYEWLPNGLAL